VNLSGVRSLVQEARGLGLAVRAEISPKSLPGAVVVSGMLADQLAKELAAGAAPGAVVVGAVPVPAHAAVLVRVIAGDPSPEDEALVRAASAASVEVVLVQLWPQADWTRPFVLSPFVVECRAGEGFPIAEIAARIVEAVEHAAALAAEVPTLAAAARAGVVRQAVVRSALIGLVGSKLGGSRPLLVREQATMVSRLRGVSSGAAVSDEQTVLGGSAAALLASGFALRGFARGAGAGLPRPLVNAAVAAAATWTFARAFQAIESRLPTP
jgi:hypothetical protein